MSATSCQVLVFVIFRNITLENNQNENETNRNAERDNPSLNSTINIPYRGN